jgi:hypothetical protein
MPQVVEDLVSGGSTSTDGNTWRDTRVFLVTEVDGEAAGRRFQAMNADGVPRRNAPHPAIPGAVVKDISCDSASGSSNTQFRVTVNYESGSGSNPNEPEQKPRVSLGSTATPVQTNQDIDGKIMKVSYQWPGDRGLLGPDEQPGTVEVQVPSTVINYTRLETESPLEKSLSFVGKVNRTSMLGQGERTWLCTRIQGDSDDDGQTYTVSYEFQLKPEGRKNWDAVVSYWDAENDAPPPNLGDPPNAGGEFDAGLAIKSFKVYESADFYSLGLGII